MEKNIALFAIVIVIGIILFVLFILFNPNFPPNFSTSDRLSLAQLIIECGSFLAILFAIREFAQASRKPNLELYVSQFRPTDPGFAPEKEFRTKLPNDRYENHKFDFHIVLENHGNAIARWVKISLLLERQNRKYIDIKFFLNEGLQDYWSNPKYYGSWLHEFDGRESFIIYSQKKDTNHKYGEVENIGKFSLQIIPKDGAKIQPDQYKIRYTIKADNMNEKTGELLLLQDE